MRETMTIAMEGDDQVEQVRPRMSREEIEAIFEKLRAYHDIPFMPEGREQPPMPDDIDLDL